MVGFAADGRTIPQLENVVGPVERYLPVKITTSALSSFGDLLEATSVAMTEALSWQMFFASSRRCFLPVCFSYYDAAWKLGSNGFSVACKSLISCTDRFDLKLSCTAGESKIAIDLWYDAATFSDTQAAHFIAQYCSFVESASSSFDQPVGSLNSISVEERKELLDRFPAGQLGKRRLRNR